MKNQNRYSVLFAGLALVLAAQTTFAFSSYRSRIPNGTTPPTPASCMVCHQADGPPLNDFGDDFDNANRVWTAALAAMDSDGDGFFNGTELGDPNGTWVQGQPNPPGPIYDPGDADSHPTAANVPPSASLTSPANGATFTAPANVTLTANAADSDGTVTLVEFLSGGTVIGSDTAAPYSTTWSGVAVGTYSLAARATDNSGATTTSAAVSITVNPAANVPPTVGLTSPANGATFTAPASVNLTANAADSDGTVTLVEFLSGNTVIGSDTTAPYSFAWNGVASGSYSLTARATDNSGATTTSAAVSITVNPAANVPPTVNLTGPANGATFTAPASVTLTANAADSDGTVTLVEFLSGGTVIGSDTTAPYSTTWSGVAVGAYSLTARATDNSGATSMSTAVTISVNAVIIAPTITQQPENRTVDAGETVTFQVAATGTMPLSYQWQKNGTDLSNGGNISGATGPVLTVANVTTADAGNYRAIVDNAANQPATSAVAVLALTTEPPPLTITLTSPDDGDTFTAPADILLRAEVSPDDNVASVEFFEGTNLLATLTDEPFAVTVTNVAEGDYMFTARVTDTGGTTVTSDSVAVQVLPPGANQAPVVEILRPREGDRFRSGRNIVLVAEASDPDGTVQSVDFFDGTSHLGSAILVQKEDDDDEHEDEDENQASTFWVLTWTNAPVGAHVLTAVGTDNQGATTMSGPVAITVQPPPPPSVRISAVDSEASVRGTNINTATFEVRRNNADGALVVGYTISGTATNGVHYVMLLGTVTIPAGERAVRFQLVPLPVDLPANVRKTRLTVTLTLSPSSATPPAYVLDRRSKAQAKIQYRAFGGHEDEDD